MQVRDDLRLDLLQWLLATHLVLEADDASLLVEKELDDASRVGVMRIAEWAEPDPEPVFALGKLAPFDVGPLHALVAETLELIEEADAANVEPGIEDDGRCVHRRGNREETPGEARTG
jgi:hypothetical protein